MGVQLPAALLRSLQEVDGFHEESFKEVHESGDQIVSVRYNPAKVSTGWEDHFPGSRPIPWSSTGYYLSARPSFTLDPWLHGGAYYVQEASSMFIEQCLRQTTDLSKPLKVLDLCAAPGGKSTLLQSLISKESLLVSNEVIRTRVNILSENMIKWGGANTIITNNDPRDFGRLENYFDVMVADAPCSGSGLFRRDAGAIQEWSTEAVEMCSRRQQRILSDAYSCLKQGGLLIYSTCSYSVQEDEDICDWLFDTFDMSPVGLNINALWNITSTHSRKHRVPSFRFFPDQVKGEGFFVACFRKNDGGDEPGQIKKHKLNRLTPKEETIIHPWMLEPQSFQYYHQHDLVLAFPSVLEQDLIQLSTSVYVKRAGVFCGKLAQGSLVPDHELAVSSSVNASLTTLSLNKEQALQYLRKQDAGVETSDKGWALVEFEGLRLGWVKLLGNRVNNYYPKEWRILKSGNS
jgi:16S rRNA C967 or C1407 C5-methylase (RsmB/RsmF family)/NOL1/NOP2/fmu family ribosome biogenesis protein